MENPTLPAPLHIIQDSRYRYGKYDAWKLDDISMCSSGNIAVSGHRLHPNQSYLSIYGSADDNSDFRNKPKLLYHKLFKDEGDFPHRSVSFIKPNSTEIVTCQYHEVHVIDYNRDVILRCRKVNGKTECLSASESQIFIGSGSNLVKIYDNDLNRIKSIRLEGIGEISFPMGMVAVADRLCVHTGIYNRAIVYSRDSGSMLIEYTMRQYGALSIAANIKLGLTAVLWRLRDTDQKQIIFYLLSENKSFLTVNVESGVDIIRISDQGRIVTGNRYTGEVKTQRPDLASLFSYSHLKESLVSRLGRGDCEKLADFFVMGGEVLKGILNSDRPASTLLLALEEKGIIQPSNVDRLEEAFCRLEISSSFYHAVNMYQKLRDTPTISTFEKFVAGFSTFLTSDLFEALCKHFNISASEKNEILLDNAPGLSLLALLKAKNIITPTDVSALAIPAFVNLKQVMAKINRYHKDLRESKITLLELQRELTLEEKTEIFIYYLHLYTKSWYESICPLPWKKASHWGLSDLFIACGLTLTNTMSHTSLKNVDTKCIVTYDDIFKHPLLQDVLRIVVEGNPGSGKTMLASQIAYDWTEGKFENTTFTILLQLKYMQDMTIPEAITKLILPLESPLTEADVEAFLENTDPCKVCLILDGLEEYTGGGGKDSGPQKSEVMEVMHGEKLPSAKVIITTRSEYLQDLPECPMLKIRQFGKQERHKYVEKIFPQDIEKRNDVIMAVENNPLLLELCDVPLLFVMAVHNIERITKVSDDETEKATPFVRNIVQTLCTMEHEGQQDQLKELKSSRSDDDDIVDSDDSKIFLLTLDEVAFNGLCTRKQQLSWPMTFLQDKVSNIRSWIDSGILIVEEEIRRTKRSVTKESTIEATMTHGPSPSDQSKVDVLIGMDTETEGMKPGIKNDDAQIIVPDIPAPSGDKQRKLETKIDRDISKNAITVLQARFLHKIIQEWFAAKHLSKILEKYNQDEVERCLNLISPIELHYVLRFACGISSEVSPLILTYLNQYHRGLYNDKQQPVADCICQCFLEHSGDREEVKEVATDFCKTGITISEEDSRQLQKAKISLLNFASENKILVQKVKLVDVWQSLLNKGNTIRLYLNSGLYLPPLYEVQSLTITSWNLKLQDLDCDLLMKYLYEWPSLQEIDLHFPVPPRKLGEDLINKISLTYKEVTWSIGTVTHYLNEKGEWPLIHSTSQSSSRTPSTHQQQRMKDKLRMRGPISQNGGIIQIPDSTVTLQIPPNAFWGDNIPHSIEMRVIPRGTYDEPAKSFTDNSSVMVELLPNNLSLRHPAELTLPHCLKLREVRKCRVSIYVSHHDEGLPNWKEITSITHHELSENNCKIWLDRFCWVKYEIDGKEVEAKKLIVYTAGHTCNVNADRVIVDVGYYPEMIGANELLQTKLKNLFVADEQHFLFRKEPNNPLQITVVETIPDEWKASRSSSSPKTISYFNIASSNEKSCPFVFLRHTEVPRLPMCIFSLCQGEESTELTIDMDKHDRHKEDLQTPKPETGTLSRDQYCGALDLVPPGLVTQYQQMTLYQGEERTVLSRSQVASVKDHAFGKNVLSITTGAAGSLPPPSYSPSSLPVYEMLTFSDLSALAKCLDPKTNFHNDWRLLADKLEFKLDDITYFDTQSKSPTLDVINIAMKRGTLKSRSQLIDILKGMMREDAASAISDQTR